VATDRIRTDVLILGGGLAGLMAAIKASEAGVSVVVVEKADARRSGAGGMGCDHFRAYVPEYHGANVEPIIEAYFLSHVGGGGMKHFDIMPLWLERSPEVVQLWDSWGIPMKHDGKFIWAGHTFPGYPHISLKYKGEGQKAVLIREARKRGAQIINRVMAVDLLTGDEGAIAGAVGIHTREGQMIEFEAKSVILATGSDSRLYPSPTPALVFNVMLCPSCTGDGRAMAYRAGAELVNVELRGKHCGPKYMVRGGQATWVGVLRDPQGRAVGTMVDAPNPEWGDPAMESNKGIFGQLRAIGKGPIYMDSAGLSDDEYQHMRNWLVQEGNTTILDYMDAEEIDPRENPLEFTTYEYLGFGGGIYMNANSETTVLGLYTAGDETPSGIGACSGAAVHGMVAGENAAHYAKEVSSPSIQKSERARKTIEINANLVNEMRSREEGAGWLEFNLAVQQTLNDYAGNPKSDGLLAQGLKHVQRLRAKAEETLKAKNQHELVRCIEALNILQLGELVFVSSLERKETRGVFVRSDYPLSLPMPRLLAVKQVDGKPVTRWEEVRRWRTGVHSANEPF